MPLKKKKKHTLSGKKKTTTKKAALEMGYHFTAWCRAVGFVTAHTPKQSVSLQGPQAVFFFFDFLLPIYFLSSMLNFVRHILATLVSLKQHPFDTIGPST